jgi:hypothetical protein
MQPSPTISPNKTDRRTLSPLKHGLTGRIYLLSQAEQIAYDDLTRALHDDLAPSGEMETQLVEALVADRWRLNRVVSLESSLFFEGAEKFANSPEATGDPELDQALSEGRVWTAEAKNLNLLSLYESRMNRRFEKNFAILRKLQADRKAAPGTSHPGGRAPLATRRIERRSLQNDRTPSRAAILFFQPTKSHLWSAVTASWRRRKSCPKLPARRFG